MNDRDSGETVIVVIHLIQRYGIYVYQRAPRLGIDTVMIHVPWSPL